MVLERFQFDIVSAMRVVLWHTTEKTYTFADAESIAAGNSRRLTQCDKLSVHSSSSKSLFEMIVTAIAFVQ